MTVDPTTPSLWETLANIATTLGFAAAFFGGLVALLSYRSANRAAESAHMHGLFREYLRMRFDYEMGASGAAAPAEPASTRRPEQSRYGAAEQLAGLKLYALEEMWEWVRREERAWALKWPMSRTRASAERIDFLKAWRATILTHANEERVEVAESILGYTHCYGVPFLEFVADGWEGDREGMKRVVKLQKSSRGGTAGAAAHGPSAARDLRRAHCPPKEARALARALARRATTRPSRS